MDRYAISLASALRELKDERLAISEVSPGPASVASRLVGRTPVFRHWVRYPRYLLTARCTAFEVNHVLDHAYGHLVHALDAQRTIVTCHDLFPLMHWRGAIPGLPRRRRRPVTVELSVAALRRARFVVADSDTTRRDLINVAGVSAETIHVVPPGVDASFRVLGINARQRAMAVWPIGTNSTKRILCVDTGSAYKNRHATLEAFARVRARTAGDDVRLIRVGPPLAGADRAHAHRLGIETDVVELQRVPESQMPLLYNSCDVLLFPSFYEGFGWPPLEAMSCGVPVVMSRAPALNEIAGDVALTANAEDYDGLAEHVSCLLEDNNEAEATRSRGLAHAQTFSWERTARTVVTLYHAILEES
jgi:glycosyltransferase involved in cell wall biosynthesis